MHARPPAMTLAGVEARHPWLDSRMRIIGYAPIQSAEAWLDAHLLLGAAVHAVILHLQVNPPTIVQFVDAGLIAIQSKKQQQQQQQNGSANNSRRAPYSNSSPPPPAYHDSILSTTTVTTASASAMISNIPDIDLPRIPNQFPELDALSRDQLEEIMQDELQFRAFCNRLPIMAQYGEIQQRVLTENAETASKHLEIWEGELKDLSASVNQLQTALQSKVSAFQVLEKKQDALCKPPDVGRVCRELTRAKKEAFEMSERIADTWLESDACSATTDAFCEEFVEARKVHHTRAAKLELLERSAGTKR